MFLNRHYAECENESGDKQLNHLLSCMGVEKLSLIDNQKLIEFIKYSSSEVFLADQKTEEITEEQKNGEENKGESKKESKEENKIENKDKLYQLTEVYSMAERLTSLGLAIEHIATVFDKNSNLECKDSLPEELKTPKAFRVFLFKIQNNMINLRKSIEGFLESDCYKKLFEYDYCCLKDRSCCKEFGENADLLCEEKNKINFLSFRKFVKMDITKKSKRLSLQCVITNFDNARAKLTEALDYANNKLFEKPKNK